jgi:2-methylcitrate dehydratase PrpD
LREAHAIAPQDLARVKLRVDKGSDTMCNIAMPSTALEAKFSLRFMGAAALAGADTSDLAFFRDEVTGDRALCALRDKVSVELVSDRPKMLAEVEIETKDGRVLRADHDAGVPGSDVEHQGKRLVAKFERLAEPVLGEARSRNLLRLLERVEEAPVADLMAACAKR